MAALAGLAMAAALLVPVSLTVATSASASEGCANGEIGHWEWGGQGGQNLYWCEAPPYEPPPTAPAATDPPAVAPKKGAPAAKPTFTG